MAENSHQDVVNQVQSTDASAPVDVSASNIETLSALAASSSAPISSNAETAAPALDKSTNGASSILENDNTSRGGHEDVSSTITESTPDPATNGISDDVSAPPSVGQSAESDTDLSKNDTTETASKGGEVPKYSVKKPSAFKSVSITKNFLAKAGTTPAQLAKSPSETPATNSTSSNVLAASSARPRLVAKAASGHKLSMSTQLSNGVKAGRSSGPDPMQVWNRNRVQAPQATPKHLTDEELRQQYGIQLASIPVIDGDDKGNKWADIDDEEDDWAPEVIEWSDGSKVNLAEASKAAAEQQAKAAEEAKTREDSIRAQQAAARTSLSLGSKATILKLGGSANQPKPGSDAALSSSKTTDKPTLVAKPVAPTPVKSPWAPLPPIEKVPPVNSNSGLVAAPTVQQRSTFIEDPSTERGHTAWKAAKEIAADDFSRAHRDAINGPQRELFNSQSGKYEPVNDARRGSMKRDQMFRHPAVLQRPAPDHDSIPGLENASVARSSSAHSDQRPELTQHSSEVHAQSEQPHLWRRQSSQWSAQPNAGPQSPALASASPGPPADANGTAANGEGQEASAQPQEDPVAVQKRLMQEKRQAAIKRRQEEEAREEAAKKERIRKKLESLPPPAKKEEKSDSASPSKSVSELAPKAVDDAKSTATKLADNPRSPPKPPAPGHGVQQYGMIKVHPSPRPNGVSPVLDVATTTPHADASMNRQPSRQDHPHHRHHIGEPHGFGDHRSNAKSALDLGHREKIPEENSRWDMSQKAWERAGDIGGLSTTPSLWAPTGSQRNLGNGDFNLHAPRGGPFGRSQISPEQILPSPQAIAPPTLFGEPKMPAPALQPQQGASFARQYDSGPAFGAKSPGDMHPQPPTTQSRTPGLPSPLAHNLPAPHSLPPPPNQLAQLPEPKLGVSAWNSFSHNAHDHDAATRARLNHDAMMQIATAESRGQPINRMITERWKQTSSGDEAGSRRVVGVQTTTRSQAPGPPATQSVGIVSEEPRQPPVSMPPQHSKSSKFQTMFKNLQQTPSTIARPSPPPPQRPSSPPVPPPEITDLFERPSLRPFVNLPGMNKLSEEKPIPVVRLPPQSALQHSILAGGRGGSSFLQGPAQPLAKSIDWQNRFNGLFGRERRNGEHADFSTSKTGFDILSVSEAAAVNFPPPGQISPTLSSSTSPDSDDKSIGEEAALFEAELHPGSTPPVRVPTCKLAADWSPAPAPSSIAIKRTAQVALHEHDITTCRAWDVGRDAFHKDKVSILIMIQGMSAGITKEIDATRVKDPRPNRLQGVQQGKNHFKNTRKTRDAPLSAGGRSSTHSTLNTAAITKPAAPAAPTGPQTWAKRLSQAVPQAAN